MNSEYHQKMSISTQYVKVVTQRNYLDVMHCILFGNIYLYTARLIRTDPHTHTQNCWFYVVLNRTSYTSPRPKFNFITSSTITMSAFCTHTAHHTHTHTPMIMAFVIVIAMLLIDNPKLMRTRSNIQHVSHKRNHTICTQTIFITGMTQKFELTVETRSKENLDLASAIGTSFCAVTLFTN